jgi:hypothetical protein
VVALVLPFRRNFFRVLAADKLSFKEREAKASFFVWSLRVAVLERLSVAFAIVFFVSSYLVPVHYLPWVAFYNEALAFFALFFLLVAVCCRNRLVVSVPVMILFIAAVVPLLQWCFGVVMFFGDALMPSLYLMAFAVAIALGQSSVRSASGCKGLEVAAWAMLSSASISAWIALCQWLLIVDGVLVVDMPMGGRAYANLGQPNNLATMLSMALIALLYLYEKRKLSSVCGVILAVFLFFGVAITQSRTPWLASFAILLFWVLKAPQCGARVSWGALLGWCGVYGIFVAALPYISDALLLSSTTPLQRMQSLHRLELWWQLLHAVLQGPIWGYGWNQISVAQVAVSLAYPVQLMTEHSHNILLDLLLWNGPLLGGVGIVLFLVWLLRLAWRVHTIESLCCLLVVGVVLVHGMLEFPLEYAFFLLPVGFLLGCVAGESRVGFQFALPRCIAVSGVLVFAGLLGCVWREYRIIEEDHRLMRFETAGIGSLKAEQAAPDLLFLTQLREFVRYARTPAFVGMDDGDIDWMGMVAQRYPYPPSLSRYSLALALNGRSAEADKQLLIICSLYGADRYDEVLHVFLTMRESYSQLRGMKVLDQPVPCDY